MVILCDGRWSSKALGGGAGAFPRRRLCRCLSLLSGASAADLAERFGSRLLRAPAQAHARWHASARAVPDRGEPPSALQQFPQLIARDVRVCSPTALTLDSVVWRAAACCARLGDIQKRYLRGPTRAGRKRPPGHHPSLPGLRKFALPGASLLRTSSRESAHLPARTPVNSHPWPTCSRKWPSLGVLGLQGFLFVAITRVKVEFPGGPATELQLGLALALSSMSG